MPTFKHPCPHCGAFINRDVVACPACGRRDPFAPGRCPNCQTPIENLSWVACPKCGEPLGTALKSAPAGATAATAANPAAPTSPTGPTDTPPTDAAGPRAGSCSGCGSPLPAGARFCRECGTAVA